MAKCISRVNSRFNKLRIRGPFKRASLNLSVDAIVIFVLAFSMMGVGLFITKLLRDKSTPLLDEAFDISLLEKMPTSQEPITVQNELTLKKGKQATVPIGFYNKGISELPNVKPKLIVCVSDAGTEVTTGLPIIHALPQKVEGSKAVAYKAILKEAEGVNLPAGKYICNLAMVETMATGTDLQHESKQIYLNLVS